MSKTTEIVGLYRTTAPYFDERGKTTVPASYLSTFPRYGIETPPPRPVPSFTGDSFTFLTPATISEHMATRLKSINVHEPAFELPIEGWNHHD